MSEPAASAGEARHEAPPAIFGLQEATRTAKHDAAQWMSKPIRTLAATPSTDRLDLDLVHLEGCAPTPSPGGRIPTAERQPTRIDFFFRSDKLVTPDYLVDTTRSLAIMKEGEDTGRRTSPSDHYPIVSVLRWG